MADPDVIDLSSSDGGPVTVVTLRGKTNHFGRALDGTPLDYHATVPDPAVWIAEHPETRDRGFVTDETGWFTMRVEIRAVSDVVSFGFQPVGEGVFPEKPVARTLR